VSAKSKSRLIDSPVSHTLTSCYAGFMVHLSRSRGSIHASSTKTTLQTDLCRVRGEYGVDVPENLEFGGIVGVVDVVDCVKKSGSRWRFRDGWGWIIANPRRLPFRNCKGAVGFFKPKAR
jgi:hypothetical protein